MRPLTVGEAKAHLSQCRAQAQALQAKLAELPPRSKVVGIITRPVPIPFAHCLKVTSDHLVVADYTQGIDGIVQWLSDLIETLDAPDGRPFVEGPGAEA